MPYNEYHSALGYPRELIFGNAWMWLWASRFNAQGNFGIAQHVIDSLSDAETQNPKTPNPKPKIPKPGHRHAGVAEQAGPALAQPLLNSTVPIGAPVSCKMDHTLPDCFDAYLYQFHTNTHLKKGAWFWKAMRAASSAACVLLLHLASKSSSKLCAVGPFHAPASARQPYWSLKCSNLGLDVCLLGRGTHATEASTGGTLRSLVSSMASSHRTGLRK